MAELTPSAQSDDAARRRAASLIGRVISQRYRIDEVIAMGGMGAVYRGEHVRMRKRVAIKILHPDTEGLPELVKRFEREAVAGAHIQHTNVATATDFGETEDGLFYLISEYVRGVTLYDIIRRGPLAPARAAHIARQLAAALAAVHAIDIVHRDLKPRNVMVAEGQNDLVKLIDFGFAKVRMERISLVSAEMEGSGRHSAAERLTSAGVVFGTMSYLAPEAAFGMDAVDARSDLFALGIILYEMLAGQHPFSADDPVQLFTKMSTLAPPPISERSPGVHVPPELEAVAQRLTKKFPEERYQTADDALEALVDACEAAALSLPVPTSTSTRPPATTSVKTPSVPPPPAVPELEGEASASASASPLPSPSPSPSPLPSPVPSPLPTPTPVPPPPAVEEAAPGTSAAAPGTSVSALELSVAAPEPSATSSDEEGAGPDQEAPARPKKKRKKKAAEAHVEAPDEAATAEPVKAPAPAQAAPPEPRRSLGPWLIGVALAAGVGVLIARSGDAPPEPAAPPRPSAAVTAAAPPSTSAAVIPASARPESAAPPRPSASPAPPAGVSSASAAPAAPKGEPDAETREALKKAVKVKTWNEAADALLKLSGRDAAALDDRDVAEAARALAIAVASAAGSARADEVYGALATRFGAAGPALLYQLVESRGRSGPAIRAADLLRKPEVAAIASPALRVSFVLRDLPCDKKLEHLDEAVQDGDARTLLVLETVVRPCFGQNHSVAEATKKLRQRLKGP